MRYEQQRHDKGQQQQCGGEQNCARCPLLNVWCHQTRRAARLLDVYDQGWSAVRSHGTLKAGNCRRTALAARDFQPLALPAIAEGFREIRGKFIGEIIAGNK